MLFTCQAYLNKMPRNRQRQAQARLAPTIRCQHLSYMWLSAAALAETVSAEWRYLDQDEDIPVLNSCQASLQQLLLLRHAEPRFEELRPKLKELLPADAPESWVLPRRISRPVSSVSMTWALDINSLRDAALRSSQKSRCLAQTPPHPLAACRGPLVWAARGAQVVARLACIQNSCCCSAWLLPIQLQA